MTSFQAYRIHQLDGRITARFDTITLDDLTPGEVVVRVQYSGINYKDALAATGSAPILRKYPLVGGIDLAGEVVTSADTRYTAGQPVLVTGCGLSETRDGGYAQFARVESESVIPLPAGINTLDAMKIGTAGFTAALAVYQMERNGQLPGNGPVVVTGATGGVGSIAVNILARRGYEVVAVSGKSDADEYLTSLGAARILRRQDIDLGKRPMEKALWAGAIDNVGGELLTWLTRTVDQWGNIASVGLAGGAELKTTVMPFILRGVNLLGINSVLTPRDTRFAVWNRLAGDLRPAQLDRICSRTVDFAELPAQFDAYLKGGVTGRTVVKIA
jgi:NADPH2:quinone reductase